MPETTKFKPRTFIDDIKDVFSFFGERKTPPPVQSYYTDPRYPTPAGPPAVPPGTTESGKFNIDLFNRVMRGDVSGVPQYIAQEAAQKATTAPKPTGMDFANPPDMVLPIPRNPAEDIVNAALDAGEQKARDQNRVTNETFLPRARERTSGLLQEDGGFQTMDFLKRVLAIMARPEFQDPRGISQGIIGAAAGLQQDEATARKAMQERQLEYDKIQADLQKEAIKARGNQKLTDPALKVIDRTAAASRGLNAIDAYRTLLKTGGPTGGVGSKFEAVIDRLGGAFNVGGGTTAQKAEALRQVILVELNEALSRGDLSRVEVSEAYKFLEEPGTWTKSSNEKLFSQLALAADKLKSIQTLGSNTLTASGYNPLLYNPYQNINNLITGKRKDA